MEEPGSSFQFGSEASKKQAASFMGWRCLFLEGGHVSNSREFLRATSVAHLSLKDECVVDSIFENRDVFGAANR